MPVLLHNVVCIGIAPNEELLFHAVAVVDDAPHFLGWRWFVSIIWKIDGGNNENMIVDEDARPCSTSGTTERTVPPELVRPYLAPVDPGLLNTCYISHSLTKQPALSSCNYFAVVQIYQNEISWFDAYLLLSLTGRGIHFLLFLF